MYTKRGYVVPVILVVLLLVLAGVFIFIKEQAESPIIEEPIVPVVPTPSFEPSSPNNSTTTTTTTSTIESDVEVEIETNTSASTSNVEVEL